MKKNSGFRIASFVLMAGAFVMSAAAGFTGGVLYKDTYEPSEADIAVQDFDVINTASVNYKEYIAAVVAEKSADSVVEIVTESVQTGSFMGQYISEGAGSGVILTVDGYIVTNHHVINGANKIKVTLKNGADYDARLIGTDPQTDIAVLKIEAKNLNAAVMGNSDALVVGEVAVAIGNPLGQLGGTVTDGIISALDREITIDGEQMTLLQTNAAINPGNSGGGLFNAKSELIGVVNAKSSGSDVEGLGFAIPVNTVRAIVDDIIEYGYVKGRISTGMSYLDITNSSSAWMYRVRYIGVYVNGVEHGSNAEMAGLRAGDLILAVNGTEVSTTAEIEKILKNSKIGEYVTYTVYRNNTQMNFGFILTEYSPV